MAKHPLAHLLVEPDADPRLADRDTGETFGWEKEWALEELERVKERLDLLQARLYAEERRSVLLVLQAMDAAGKDGTIRSILSGLNPAGVHVASFKVPGGREVQHDYLWRVHEQAPAKGHIGVFNRSHYEDVLVVRVKGFAPKEVWSKRYEHIREFEQLLADEGTRIVKCFLHVGRDEQRERLQERVDDPEKRWKFRKGDLEDRALWKDFMEAYEDAIRKTSTKYAPWYVVPADHNWSRNLAVAQILLDVLEDMDPQLPPPEDGIEGLVVE
ncbi:MAG: polyphosphate kinase 2 family protein [Ilumatobacter sp.]|nr:polyphosphate kinase 2 family protein [Ilumatobacter sp.]MCB0984750.1 polyphosphate kinase 2 family protein [Ilumatobacter sp.]